MKEDIHHGTIHLLMVPVGEYALVVENNVPKILKTGTYVIDSSYFSVSSMLFPSFLYLVLILL